MGLVSFERVWGLGKFSYFLANSDCFFHRFADSGFKNKWTGLWKHERKFLEYFAMKIGGDWLSPEKCKSIRYNFASAVHTYSLGSKEIRETVFIPENSDALVVELSSEGSMDAEIELAVNIRKRVENRTGREYSVEDHGKCITVSNELGRVSIHALKGEPRFEPFPSYREHSPSGEAQNYFYPGRVLLSGEDIAIAILPSLADEKECGVRGWQNWLKEKEEIHESLIRGKINSDNRDLVRGFNSSILATELLRKRINGINCYYAGLPWFQQFWARDLFWVMPSMIMLGCFRDARDCLRYFATGGCNRKKVLGFFAKSDYSGAIPNFISETEGNPSNAIDSTLLWIISLEHYALASGDIAFIKDMRPALVRLLGFLSDRDNDSDGFIEHDVETNETWMDTLNRKGRGIEIESLYFRALRSALKLLALIGDGESALAKGIRDRLIKIGKGFDASFFKNGFYDDKIPAASSGIRTANALAPLLCGFRKHERQVLDIIESDIFTTPVGVRSHALGEGFMNGYHTGMVWSLTTAWASAAEFAAKRPEAGWKYLSMLIEGAERGALGSVGECWDSLTLQSKGCSLQLWGSAFILMIVDRFMLGIKPDAVKRCIYVNPSLPPETNYIEREIPLGNERARLMFERDGNKVSVSCDNTGIMVINRLEQTIL